MTKELTPAIEPEEKGVALSFEREPIPGMEHFDPADLEVPYIKLIQGTSDVKAGRPGQFINTTSNEVFDAKELILISYAKETKTYENKQTGVPDVKEQYRFLAIDPVNKFPAFVVAGGTSLWAAKKYLNQFFQAGMPLFSAVTSISSVSKENKRGLGKYHVVNFEAKGDTPDDLKAFALDFWTKYGKKMIASAEKEDRAAIADVEDYSQPSHAFDNGEQPETNLADVPFN